MHTAIDQSRVEMDQQHGVCAEALLSSVLAFGPIEVSICAHRDVTHTSFDGPADLPDEKYEMAREYARPELERVLIEVRRRLREETHRSRS